MTTYGGSSMATVVWLQYAAGLRYGGIKAWQSYVNTGLVTFE